MTEGLERLVMTYLDISECLEVWQNMRSVQIADIGVAVTRGRRTYSTPQVQTEKGLSETVPHLKTPPSLCVTSIPCVSAARS